MVKSAPVIARVGDLELSHCWEGCDGWQLKIAGAVQSCVNMNSPGQLHFSYTKWVASAVEAAAPGAGDIVHLGAGGMALPRYFATKIPGVRQHVVDMNQTLIEFLENYLPAPPGCDISIYHEDAKVWLEQAPESSADVLIADIFVGDDVPSFFDSVDHVRLASRVLRPGATYVINFNDQAPFTALDVQLKNLSSAFRSVRVLASPNFRASREVVNVVVVAANHELPMTGFKQCPCCR